MKNNTIKTRVQKIADAFGYGERADEIVNVIENVYKKNHLDVKAVISGMIERLKNGESFDGLITKKPREESEATKNARYEKALAKLNAKYGKGE